MGNKKNKNMSTIENNKLIAEFMGATIRMTDMNPENNTVFLSGETYFQDRLKYHTSWEWLMPVVSKCRTESNTEDSHWEAIYYTLEECNIKITYKAVVEFIKWYNEKK